MLPPDVPAAFFVLSLDTSGAREAQTARVAITFSASLSRQWQEHNGTEASSLD
jgi:hypothetical protein